MRVHARSPRRFRPLLIALEPLSPVSTLVPGLATAAIGTIGGGATPGRFELTEQDARSYDRAAVASSSSSAHLDLSSLVSVTNVSANGAGASSMAPPVESATIDLSPSGSVATVNLIATTAPSLPSTAPVRSAVPQPRATGGALPPRGQVASPAPRGSSGAPTASSPTAPTAPNPIPAVAGAVGPIGLASTSSVAAPTSTYTIHVGGGDGKASLNDAGQAPYIRIYAGNSYVFEGTGTGNTIPGTVPIGALFACSVAPPVGSGLTIDTVAWSGLGAVGAYITGGGDDPPPASMPSIPTPVLDKTPTTFLVAQPETPYTVSVTVTYTQGGGGTSSVQFTSGQYPSYKALRRVEKIIVFGQPETVAPPAPGISPNRQALWFANSDPNHDGIGIEAQTSPDWPGNYMLMQLTSTLRQYTDGQNIYQIANTVDNPDKLQAFDNGAFGGTTNTLGMEVGPVNNYSNMLDDQWTQNGGQDDVSQDYVAFDRVEQGVPSQTVDPKAPTIPTQVSVGGLNGNGGDEKFTTYLMYQPGPNVNGGWVPIGKLTWGWGGTANVQQGNFVGQVLSPFTEAVNAVPLSADLSQWPKWNTTTTALAAAGWKQVQ